MAQRATAAHNHNHNHLTSTTATATPLAYARLSKRLSDTAQHLATNRKQKTTTAPTSPAVNAVQTDWLIRQAVDHFKASQDKFKSVGSRATNRRKFLSLLKQLLPIAGSQKCLGSAGTGMLTGWRYRVGNGILPGQSRHSAARFIALVPIPMKCGRDRAASCRPIGLGPWDGARVAPQQSPILRPGRFWL